MTLSADTVPAFRSRSLLLDLAGVLRTHLPRSRTAAEQSPTPQDALLRALCHDLSSPLAALEGTLRHLERAPEDGAELVQLARAQTAWLSSMLRTATATGGATRRGPAPRRHPPRPGAAAAARRPAGLGRGLGAADVPAVRGGPWRGRRGRRRRCP